MDKMPMEEASPGGTVKRKHPTAGSWLAHWFCILFTVYLAKISHLVAPVKQSSPEETSSGAGPSDSDSILVPIAARKNRIGKHWRNYL
jgi:hypothetical protein